MLDEVKQYIRSYVPGRLRLRHPGLKGIDADTEKLIVETVTSASGITGCTINPEVGSLLLTWDRHALTEEDLLGYLSFWAAFIPPRSTPTQDLMCSPLGLHLIRKMRRGAVA